MEPEKRALKLLLGKAENRIKFVHGLERAAVDFLLARRAMRRTLGRLMDDRIPLPGAISLFDRLLTLASGGKNKKYVYYNGSVFLDCFAPRWPGKVFDMMYDAMLRNLMSGTDEWLPFIPSLIFSITRKCVYRCEHCYAIQTLGSGDVTSAEELLKIAKDFQKIGVGVIAWEGGEPLLRFDDLLTLIRKTSDRSDSLLATTAFGLTREAAEKLADAGLASAIISLDHFDPDRHNAFRRNKKAFDMAVNGVRTFRECGILPSIAVCATRELMDEGGLYQYLELAKDIGAGFIQILDATPSGNYIGRDVILSKSQLEEIKEFHLKINTDPRFRDYPSIQARAFLEDDENYGCCAGNALCYVDPAGNLQPCDLLQISFGNVLDEGVAPVYARMKKRFPHPTKGRCPAQTLNKLIAMEYEKTGALPLRSENCERILEKISNGELPAQLKKISAKRAANPRHRAGKTRTATSNDLQPANSPPSSDQR
ncbi:MAG: radical SAM protein [bacterium]